MKNKKTYSVSVMLPKNVQLTFVVDAYGFRWIPTEVEKILRVNCPDTYLHAEIIRTEKIK